MEEAIDKSEVESYFNELFVVFYAVFFHYGSDKMVHAIHSFCLAWSIDLAVAWHLVNICELDF